MVARSSGWLARRWAPWVLFGPWLQQGGWVVLLSVTAGHPAGHGGFSVLKFRAIFLGLELSFPKLGGIQGESWDSAHCCFSVCPCHLSPREPSPFPCWSRYVATALLSVVGTSCPSPRRRFPPHQVRCGHVHHSGQLPSFVFFIVCDGLVAGTSPTSTNVYCMPGTISCTGKQQCASTFTSQGPVDTATSK